MIPEWLMRVFDWLYDRPLWLSILLINGVPLGIIVAVAIMFDKPVWPFVVGWTIGAALVWGRR